MNNRRYYDDLVQLYIDWAEQDGKATRLGKAVRYTLPILLLWISYFSTLTVLFTALVIWHFDE